MSNHFSAHFHLEPTTCAKLVVHSQTGDAWVRILLAGNLDQAITLFPIEGVSKEKLAALVDCFNDCMAPVAQVEEAA